MNEGNISTPINEQLFLKRNALVCIVLGIFFLTDFIYNYFNSSIEIEFLNFILFIVSIGFIVMFLMSANKIGKNVFLFGNFKDEYLNHIHNTGYKYSFSFISLFLVVLTITSSLFPKLFSTLPVHEFSKLSAGLMFISYSLPILFLLRGEDE